MQVFTRFWKGTVLWVLEPSLPTEAILHFSCLVWFIADFLFCWGHDDFNHEFKDHPKGSYQDRHPVVTVATVGNWPEDVLSLDLVGWKGSACGDLYTSFFTTKSQLSKENGCFLPPLALRFLSRFSLATHALSSQGAKVLYKQVFSSRMAITLICNFRDARRYLLRFKKL